MESDELKGWQELVHRPASDSQDPLFRLIREALQEGRWLDIMYSGGTSPGDRRRIKPLELFRVDGCGETYVRAFCDTRQEERTFRLDRITFADLKSRDPSHGSTEQTTLEDSILSLLARAEGLKARQITDTLGIDRGQVNSLLYGKLRAHVRQDKSYRWHLRDAESERPLEKEAGCKDTPLAKLCRYYLDCLSHDDLGGVSVFASSKYDDLDYAELEALPMLDDNASDPFDSESGQRLLAKVRRDRNRQTILLGYPVRLNLVHSRKGWEGFKVEPLLLFSFQDNENKYRAPVLADDLPQINFRALSSLSNTREAGLMTEAVQLAEELGLANVGADQPDIDELVARLREIRSEWDWQEKIDPRVLSKGPLLSDLKQAGIFNRAILIAMERSPYTKGLESELGALQNVDDTRYAGTALGAWLSGQIIESPPADQQALLEVLPLNSEQRQAVRQALSNAMTVITGPPGTGKSQVVTSILVNAAWQGKTVLFASKNNKAVDVVETRVNALGPRPVLLRMGANEHRARLAEYLLSLLAARTTSEDNERYRESEAIHARLRKRSDDMDVQVRSLVDLRNQVDKLEQEAERLRHDLSGEGFAHLRDVNSEELGQAAQRLMKAIDRANKNTQPFCTRLIWPLVRKRRYIELEREGGTFKSTSEEIGLPAPQGESTYYTVDEWVEYGGRLANRIADTSYAQQYFSQLARLINSQSLEDLSKDRRQLTEELAANSEELWQMWLRLQPSRLTLQQRTLLGDYSALLQMIVSADEENQQIGRDIFRRYYQLFPQITPMLPCWAVTSLSARGRIPFDASFFDVLVIDEASQCDIASALPLLYRARQVVVIGDPKQLRHISTLSRQREQQLLSRHGLVDEFPKWAYSTHSLFDLACSLSKSEDIVALRDHHRSHSDIIEFSNGAFYEDRLRVATRYDRLKRPWSGEPAVRWIDIRGKVVRLGTGGAMNEDEVHAVVKEVERLISQGYSGTIGVVSPFRAQANRIRDLVTQHVTLAPRLAETDFLAETVYKFQGDERDVMIFSPVVSKGISDSALGFLRTNPNIFNVAITRARAALIVVGDKAAALNSGVDYLAQFAAYSDHIRDRREHTAGCVAGDLGPVYPRVSNPEQVSEWERILYRELYRTNIRPIPQYVVEKYVLDFAVIVGHHRLNIEVDGERYHRNWDGELCRRDQIRNERLMELGWDVMRFWVYQVRDSIETCIHRVEQWIREHGH